MEVYTLPKEVIDILNARLQDEYNAERFYKNLSKWCDQKGWAKASKYFVCMMHKAHHLAHKLERYATDRNTDINSPTVSMPEATGETYVDLIEQSYEMENTQLSSYKGDVVSISDTQPDFALFLEKYIKCHQKWLYEYSEMLKKLQGISGDFELRAMEKKVF